MTVKLYSAPRKYIGLKADTKPVTTDSETIPTGSTFEESDTGRLFRWNGYAWNLDVTESDDARILDALHSVLQEMQEIKMVLLAAANS